MHEPQVITPHEPAGSEAGAQFIAYTHFPPAEELAEQYLGERARVLLPPSWRASFVRHFPWVVLVLLPLHALAVLTLVGVSALAALFGDVSVLGGLLAVGVLVCDVVALPGLFKRSRQGWTFLTYALVLSALESVLSLSLFGFALDVALVWVAFQVKYRYA